jgi:hypothetical protein
MLLINLGTNDMGSFRSKDFGFKNLLCNGWGVLYICMSVLGLLIWSFYPGTEEIQPWWKA